MYKDQPLQHYLDDLAAGQSTPGGGSAAALSGAIAAALASMVSRLTLGKAGYEAVQTEVEAMISQTEQTRQRFSELLEEDIAAYGQLSAAYTLPRGTEQERSARSKAIQERLREAALVPLEVVESAARLSAVFTRIARVGNASILSDLEIAVTLASASAHNAAAMVRVNLRFMRDAILARELQTRLDDALRKVEEDGQRALAIVETRS